MDFETIIFNSLSDVPDPPEADQFSISGCTVVCYHVHRFTSREAILQGFTDGTIITVTDDRSYATKLRPDAGLEYTQFIDAGPMPAALTRVVGGKHAYRLGQSVLWLGEEYALSAVPIMVSIGSKQRRGIELAKPLTVDGLLRFLSLLADPAMAAALSRQIAAGLAVTLNVTTDQIERSWPVPGSFAIQIWNLDGTRARESGHLYEGVRESAKYSWEISAILSHNSDHLQEDGLWLRRSRQQIYSLMRSGSCFFEDHMVFVTPDCCLEMAHLPAWLRDRSHFRLEEYGYDSSSIFVWSTAILRSVIVNDLGRHYRNEIARLATREMIATVEQAELSRTRIRHARLLDRILNFSNHLVEIRNRVLDQHIFREISGHRALTALADDMEKHRVLAASLNAVHEESERLRRDSRLALLAMALAAVQIPDFVNQVSEWVVERHWLRLGISVALIIAPLALVLRTTLHASHRTGDSC